MNFLLLPAEDLVVNTKARDKIQLVEHSRKEMIITDVILTYYTLISDNWPKAGPEGVPLL